MAYENNGPIATTDLEVKRIKLSSSASITPRANGTASLVFEDASGTDIATLDTTNQKFKFNTNPVIVNNVALQFEDSTATARSLAVLTAANAMDVGATTNVIGSLNLYGGAATGISIDNDGNVGVGVSAASSSERLHVSGGHIALSRTGATAPGTPGSNTGVLFLSGGGLYFIGSSGTSVKLADA